MNKLYNKTLHVFKNVMREEDKEILTPKKTKFYGFFVISLWGLFIPFAFSQNGEHVGGGDFLKRIEYNYSFHSKGEIEKKLFFWGFNAQFEFFYDPSFEASLKGASGFRIVRFSQDTFSILQFKHIPNYEKVYRELSNTGEKRNEEMMKLFKVETLSFPVSDQFAEKLYKKMVSFIDNFKARQEHAAVIVDGDKLISETSRFIFDGYRVTFRTVVDDEVWSLNIHEPRGDALKMADFCRQIMTDMETKTFKESKYVEILDNIYEKE